MRGLSVIYNGFAPMSAKQDNGALYVRLPSTVALVLSRTFIPFSVSRERTLSFFYAFERYLEATVSQ